MPTDHDDTLRGHPFGTVGDMTPEASAARPPDPAPTGAPSTSVRTVDGTLSRNDSKERP